MQFHELMKKRKPLYWHSPIRELIAGVLLAGVFALVLIGAVVLWGFIDPSADTALEGDEWDMMHPAVTFAMLGSLGIFTPALILAARWTGRRPGFLVSVSGRMRWNLLRRGLAIGLVSTLIGTGLLLIFTIMSTGEPLKFRLDSNALILLAILVIMVPAQAAGEELLFRGLLPQIAGAWGVPAWLAYALPIPLFTWGHLYSPGGLVFIAIFAVAMAAITHRSGGLEIAIGIHTMNNLVIFAAGALSLTNINEEDPSLLAIACGSIELSIAMWLAWRMTKQETKILSYETRELTPAR